MTCDDAALPVLAGTAPGGQLAAASPPPQGLPRFTEAELWQVLARQAALYTNMDSSSVPVETAAELVESVLFCVRTAYAEARPGAAPRPLAEWLLAGQRVLTLRHSKGKRLLAQARAASLPLENPVYQGALDELAGFFTWYDIRFLAHQIPGMLDYPLALPVSEALLGVDYILEYLRRRLWEDVFCARFSTAKVKAVLHRHSPDWRELPLNLFEPVFTWALGGALAPGELETPDAPTLEARLRRAGARLCGALRLWGTAQRAYCAECAAALAPRVLAADAGGLARLFPSDI